MNQLINIEKKDGQLVVSSREVAANFKKRHDNVLRDIDNLLGGILKIEETPNMFISNTYVNEQNGQTYREYLLTRDGFSLLVMGFTGAKALEWKLKYIEAFNKMEQYLKTKFTVPGTFSEALRLAADLQEKNEKLALEAAANKPKVLFADAVDASHTSILIGDLAKLLRQNGVETGQNRLFDWLRINSYLIKSGDRRNMPTQRAMEQGLFEVKETTITNPDGSIRITRTTKVTGKGQVYFVNRLLGDKRKGA